jgi:hypothetical protein
MKKHELESFMTDMNSLEPLPSQPLASTPKRSTPKRSGTPRSHASTPKRSGTPGSHRKKKSALGNKRKDSGSSSGQNITKVTPGEIKRSIAAVAPSNILGSATPASNKRKDSGSSSRQNSRNEDRTNINSQDLKDGMNALKEGFKTFGVVTEEGELRDMLGIIVKCYESGYCAEHRTGDIIDGKMK